MWEHKYNMIKNHCYISMEYWRNWWHIYNVKPSKLCFSCTLLVIPSRLTPCCIPFFHCREGDWNPKYSMSGGSSNRYLPESTANQLAMKIRKLALGSPYIDIGGWKIGSFWYVLHALNLPDLFWFISNLPLEICGSRL